MGSAIETLFRPEARVITATAAVVDEALMPDELAYIRNAVSTRRAEFGTARLCARRALADLGVGGPVSLVPKADRAPVWPAGTVGSISHTTGFCAVVVDRAPPMRSIGLDVEVVRPLEDGMAPMIMTPRERAWVAARAASDADALTILHFSAKEAFYKCQYPISSTFLDFADVELDLEFDDGVRAGRFLARVLAAGKVPAAVARLAGRFAFDDGRVACGVDLRA